MEGKEIFSKFDIRWGYNNIPIQTEDRFKGAFKMPLGTYQPRVLYFGMKNAPAQWTRLMLHHFKPWYDKWYNYKETTGGSYMDDFTIGSKNTPKGREGHKECTHDLLTLMEKGGFHLRPAKCWWEERRLEFLGVIIENGRMRIDPAKREGISRWPRTLVDRTDVQRMMGTLQYHRQFIPGFSDIAQPIFVTLKKGTPFVWTKEAEIALDTLIKRIESDPQLDQPNMEKPFELEIDTSNYATGAVLI
jgi:Reverse transcriptase (RNA-dependent DNA polymerase)/RNase H-like domain found in reverse transcriptase